MTRRLSLSLALGAAALLAAAAPGLAAARHRTFVVTAKASGRTLVLHVGDRLDVVLDANEGTAYRWRLVTRPDARVIKHTSTSVLGPPVTVPPTAGGQDEFTYHYRATGRGTTRIAYALASSVRRQKVARRLRLKIVVRR